MNGIAEKKYLKNVLDAKAGTGIRKRNKMEIRVENTIKVEEVTQLKKTLDDFFNVDFNIVIESTYIYFRDN